MSEEDISLREGDWYKSGLKDGIEAGDQACKNRSNYDPSFEDADGNKLVVGSSKVVQEFTSYFHKLASNCQESYAKGYAQGYQRDYSATIVGYDPEGPFDDVDESIGNLDAEPIDLYVSRLFIESMDGNFEKIQQFLSQQRTKGIFSYSFQHPCRTRDVFVETQLSAVIDISAITTLILRYTTRNEHTS